MTLRYEDLNDDPAGCLGRIVMFLSAQSTDEQIADVAGIVRPASVGKGRKGRKGRDLDLSAVLPVMQTALARHGYGV
ncbi:MAG: hypothetical protein AAF674_11120 [Pseudomonadota bacterium]